MASLNAIKNRIRTLGLTDEDDEVASDSSIAAVAREKALDKSDMATGVYSGPGALLSNAYHAATGELKNAADSRKNVGSRAARQAESEVKRETRGKAKGGAVKMASGGKVSSASSRADGIAQRGKTKGRYL